MEPKTKEEIMVDVNEKLKELNEMERTAELLKSNVNEFIVGETTYKVHKPTAREKDELNKERMKKYIEFLNDSSYLFRDQLAQLLKKKGVDIAAMEKESLRIHANEKELLKRLAKITIKQDVEALKEQIIQVRLESQELFLKKEDYLRYCIEKQLEDFVRFYVLYQVLEIKNGETWEKAYKSYEDFQKADDDLLLGRAAQVLSYMIYNDGL